MKIVEQLAIVGIAFVLCNHALAGIVAGGTRFIFPSDQESITIQLTNTGDKPNLISSKIKTTVLWEGARESTSRPPLVAAPPLFLLKPKVTGMLRLVKTGDDLPADRETLFSLVISAIPPGEHGDNSIKLAVRSTYKLIWRPQALYLQEPKTAYQRLKWSLNSSGVVVDNPTPFYITLVGVTVNDLAIADGGVVAPKSRRQLNWCQNQRPCRLMWRTVDDYGGLTPQVSGVVQ